MSKLERFRCLELMAKSLIKVIQLHREGVESYSSVLNRFAMMEDFMQKSKEKK